MEKKRDFVGMFFGGQRLYKSLLLAHWEELFFSMCSSNFCCHSLPGLDTILSFVDVEEFFFPVIFNRAYCFNYYSCCLWPCGLSISTLHVVKANLYMEGMQIILPRTNKINEIKLT